MEEYCHGLLKVLIDISLMGVRIVMNCNCIQYRAEFRNWSLHSANRNTKLYGFNPLKVGNFGVLCDAVHIRDYAVEW